MKYIGFYDLDNNKVEKRNFHSSARSKMNYITSVLNNIGYEVEIISPSWTQGGKYFGVKKTEVNNLLTITLGPTIPYIYFFSQIWSMLWLTFYLLFKVKRNETILVYHSLILMFPISILKIFKNSKIILEVEEIYSLVVEEKKSFSKLEMKYIKNMEKRILVSSQLKSVIGSENDLVLYGSYNTKNDKTIPKNLKKIVYAGTIDEQRSAAFNAIEMMKYINDKDYNLLILGTGDDEDIVKLNNSLNDVNAKLGYPAVKYLGSKGGKEFDDIMNSCNIALNLQKTGEYMDTAFPSKILSYFSYNLTVVSTKVESIYYSPFSEYITFVDSNDPKEWANIVRKIDNNSNKIDKMLEFYNKKFTMSLKNILEDTN